MEKKFLQMQLSLEQYKQLLDCYHGGYTHANRFYVNRIVTKKCSAMILRVAIQQSFVTENIQ